MKKSLIVTVVLLALPLYIAYTQPPTAKVPKAGATKVAVVNVGRVLARYIKTPAFRAPIEPTRKKQADVESAIQARQKAATLELWKDIQEAVKICAGQRDIKLVVGYGDPQQPDAVNDFDNVCRKMNAMDQGALVPLFVEPDADLTDAVMSYLNEQRRSKTK